MSDALIYIGGFISAAVLMILIGIYFLPRVRYNPKQGLRLRLLFSNYKFDVTMVQLKNSQQVLGQLVAKDAKGDDAQVQAGSVQATLDNEEVASVELDPDDQTKITVKGKRAGATVLRISADADLGEGVKTITTEIAVEITAGEAVGFGVTFGEPEEQQ